VSDAEWEQHAGAANGIRNPRMLECGRPDIVIACPGGPGTDDMIQRAEAAGMQGSSLRSDERNVSWAPSARVNLWK
jgi:hypothetical protein